MREAAAALLALAAACAPARAGDGAALFGEHCAACHGEKAEGTPNIAPPLVSPVIAAAGAAGRGDYVARVVLAGLAGRISVGGQTFVSAMPPQPALADDEIAAIAGWLLVELNGAPAGLATEEVAALRADPVPDGGLLALRGAFAP